MTVRINDQAVTGEEEEFGVEFDDGFVLTYEDEEEARTVRQMTGGKVVCRNVYCTAWAVVD